MRIGAHRAQPDAGAHEACGYLRILESSVGSCHLGDRVEFTREAHLLSQRRDATLKLQQPHRDPPTVAGLADDEVGVGGRVVEEDLVEFRCSSQLLDRPHRDAGLVDRNQQETEPLMTRRTSFGTRQHEHPLRHMRERRPDLLSVDMPTRAVVGKSGRRGDAREIGARPGFGIALGPQLGDVDDSRKEALLLLFRTELDQRRAEQLLTEVIHPRRRVRARILLMEDDSLLECRATAPIPRGPTEACPAGRREVAIPRQPLGEELVLAPRPTPTLERGEVADEILRQPLAHRSRELFGRVGRASHPFAQVDGTIGKVDRRHDR
ncbi:Uncharacterised protein [Mycobacteroides abscessus subsp. abscessus]|nr:Uncharacterised protein [Mycobacteroides abscessus subsp. abscessus]